MAHRLLTFGRFEPLVDHQTRKIANERLGNTLYHGTESLAQFLESLGFKDSRTTAEHSTSCNKIYGHLRTLLGKLTGCGKHGLLRTNFCSGAKIKISGPGESEMWARLLYAE